MKYAFIKLNRVEHSVSSLCRVLMVSSSGYYAWHKNSEKRAVRDKNRKTVDNIVKDAFDKHQKRYGARRLARYLANKKEPLNRKTIAVSLKRQGLIPKAAKKFKATTNSKHTLPVAPNLLEQDFTATAPNQKWAGDITYVWTDEGWLYLAVMLDLFSRKVIGWSMSERMTAELACDTLRMALWRRRFPKGVIVHSDRGSQYCSNAYQKLLTGANLRCSMSAKGNCYDNAPSESFFHSLKVELIHGERFHTREEAKQAIFEYLEAYYNRNRLHSTNGYLSPVDYELKFAS